MHYPSWREEQSGAGPEVVDQQPALMLTQTTLESRVDRILIKEWIRAGVEGHSRRDCILIRTPNRIRCGRVDAMSKQRVAQVFLLF